ncbi:uncharacterized protein LOC111698412 [Eurytemora carolleeae]|uniref:uncharacterized protein LOC111698412 n=1 Tax=Eurytemora carolleeae TaxID=1294199 RepID=UPI000C766A90|nr:uncharacterized protein LOC111698412 [Eurytemora carolleeae]|eukprot:XP_023324513.1 uncharacterized protein LOC111698412 [Eurytemora affinis]
MIVGDEIGDDRQQKQSTTDRNILENDRLKSESSGGFQMANRFIDIETNSCAETSLTNVQTRSPEMAPRLVYRNKKYGRKSCPPTLQEKYSSQHNQQFFTVNYSRVN